jgi:hypothetical protein
MLVHTVFFWLKKSAPKTARAKLIKDCRSYLKTPTVRHLWAGPPAPTPDRPVIDATYDVGLTVVFDNLAAHDAYQEHPEHLKFIARNKAHWQRVVVYDVK